MATEKTAQQELPAETPKDETPSREAEERRAAGRSMPTPERLRPMRAQILRMTAACLEAGGGPELEEALMTAAASLAKAEELSAAPLPGQ